MRLRAAIRHALVESIRAASHGAVDVDDPTRALMDTVAGDEAATTAFVTALEQRLLASVVHARLVVTGSAWIGGDCGAVETALLDLISEATTELALSIYSLGSALEPVLGAVEARLAVGVRVAIVINDLANQPAYAVQRLAALQRRYPHLRVRDFGEVAISPTNSVLHAKVIVADRSRALIGSANLSRGGLVGNHEMALFIEGAVAETAAQRIEAIFEIPTHSP